MVSATNGGATSRGLDNRVTGSDTGIVAGSVTGIYGEKTNGTERVEGVDEWRELTSGGS